MRNSNIWPSKEAVILPPQKHKLWNHIWIQILLQALLAMLDLDKSQALWTWVQWPQLRVVVRTNWHKVCNGWDSACCSCKVLNAQEEHHTCLVLQGTHSGCVFWAVPSSLGEWLVLHSNLVEAQTLHLMVQGADTVRAGPVTLFHFSNLMIILERPRKAFTSSSL